MPQSDTKNYIDIDSDFKQSLHTPRIMSPNLRKSQKLFHTGREDKRNLSLEKIQNSEAAKSRERKVPVFYSQKYEHSELKLPRNDKYSKLYKQYSTHTASIAGNLNFML